MQQSGVAAGRPDSFKRKCKAEKEEGLCVHATLDESRGFLCIKGYMEVDFFVMVEGNKRDCHFFASVNIYPLGIYESSF